MAPPWTELTYAGARAGTGDATVARWTLVPGRWGRHRVGPVRLRVARRRRGVPRPGRGRGRRPGRLPGGGRPGPGRRAARAGGAAGRAHRAASVGSGVEFAGVRPYAHGDRQRDVDWRVSARHGDLFVRQYAAERAFDLVLVLDTAVDAGEPGRSSLDLTVRAATGLVQTYLRSHDRVGLVTFGGPLRWLTPGHRSAPALPGDRGADVGAAGPVRAGRRARSATAWATCRAACCRAAPSSPCSPRCSTTARWTRSG